jgi:NAD(P)H dehydrogenase (quinone)
MNKEQTVKHAVIIAHPKPASFTAAVAAAYAQACKDMGHELVVRDLYRIGFDPCLKATELPFDEGFQPGSDVAAERLLLNDCAVFAFFYPLWLNAPPAMMKGYLERVFGFGFAYGTEGRSYNPLLSGRKLISFSSSGAPADWLEQTGSLPAVRTLFDQYFAKLCGMTVVDHVHVGNITPGASPFFVQARLDDVRKTVNSHFGRPTCH